jgi:hypothetical protein
LSLVLQLKSVGIERPEGHATEALITAFSLLYSAVDIFRPADLNALLEPTRRLPVRTDQIFEKIHPTAHGANFPILHGFFKTSSRDLNFKSGLNLPSIALDPLAPEQFKSGDGSFRYS